MIKHFCPVSGLPVTFDRRWCDRRLDDHFVARFFVIGKSILYSGPEGFADMGSAESVLELKKEVVRHVSGGSGPYIQIEDYTHLHNATLDARKYFAQYMIQEKRVRSLIFCNLSPLMRIIVRIGSRLNTSSREIHVVEGYREAVELAIKLCRIHGFYPGAHVFGTPFAYSGESQNLVPVEVLTEANWDSVSPRFQSRSMVIDRQILFSRVTGNFGEAEVAFFARIREEAVKAIGPDAALKYFLVDVSGLDGFDIKARRMQMASLRQWHQKHPVRMYLFLGVTPPVATAARMAIPSLAFRIELVQDMGQAFDLIHRDQLAEKEEFGQHQIVDTDPKKRYADELLSFIDAINWEEEGIQSLPGSVDIRHPFYLVFQAILMIKAELDQLFNEQRDILTALEESEKKYRELFENGSDLLFFHDPEGNLMETNPAFKRGLGEFDTQSEHVNARNLLAKGPRNEFDDYMARIFRHGHDTGITTLTTADGREIILEYNNILVKDSNGQPLGVSGSARDITARIRAEKENRKLQEQLRQRQKLEAIGTLAGGIAHDFNNIISIVLGNAELALEMTPVTNPSRDFLDEIFTACARARDVVRQLLTFSRKTDVQTNPLDIGPVVKESLKLLRSTIPRSIEFRYGIPSSLPAVATDPGHLHQIMINLCTNAADAMSEKGGILEVDIEPVVLDDQPAAMVGVSPGEYVRLIVRDTGCGIDPKNLERIFDPYFTTKEIGKGTGMGLATVHGIIKRYKGGIRVESSMTGGTRFDLYFPVSAYVMDSPEEQTIVETLTGTETILFVDDEKPIAELSHRHLEGFGYRVQSTSNPVEALRWFQEDPDQFDLLITDMSMPRITGDKLAKAVLKIRPDMPIILCTGYSEMISKERAEKMGIRRFMEKPLEKRDLARAVRKVLDEASQ